MSRAAAVTAVADFVTPASVPLLNKVFPYPPRTTKGGEFDLGANAGSGGLAFIHIEGQSEHRIASGGAALAPRAPIGGRKWRQYQVLLLVFLRSTKQSAQSAGVDNDTLLDGLCARIQADRTMGGAFFQAGEGGPTGGDDLVVDAALPKTLNSQIVQVFSTVRFAAVEILDT